jgi:chitin disaccharide deacetylase
VSERVLVVNADDFGASEGINRGIIETHVRGIVTSASLMVAGPAATAAVALGREHPALGIGLHWALEGEGFGAPIDLGDAVAVRVELARQLDAFHDLVGRPPDHIDFHHHMHRRDDVGPHVGPIARELAAPLGVPLRGESVPYVGGFYAQWEWKVTDLHHVSPGFLVWILRNEVGEGWTELGCHPGYVTPDFRSVYLAEREAELATLTDPTVREEIDALGIRLASFAELGGQLET